MAQSSDLAAIAGPCIPVAEAMSGLTARRGRTPYVAAQGRRIVRAWWHGRKGSGHGSARRRASYHRSTMTFPIDVSRRSFLVNASRGTIALAVLGVTGCGPTALSSVTPSEGSSVPGAGSSGASGSAPTGGSAGAPPSSAVGSVTWQRANLGFVSAYVLARAGEAAIVDTGLPGGEGTIHEALKAAGLDWGNVGHVILTHRHGDH